MSEVEGGGYSEEERAEAEKFNEMVDRGEILPYEMIYRIGKETNPEDLLPDRVNLETEAREVNGMIGEGLLSRQEAANFSFENEIQLPENWLQESPKVSEQLRRHIILKFPPESFNPENAIDTPVHGTHFFTLRPMWLGEGKRWSVYGGKEETKFRSKKGVFDFYGDFQIMGPKGFQDLGEAGMGTIALVFEKIPGIKYDRGSYQYSRSEVSQLPRAIIVKPREYTGLNQNLEQVAENEEGIKLSEDQRANFCANTVARGVNRSLIIPIYNQEGKLLWPTEEDVKEGEKSNTSMG